MWERYTSLTRGEWHGVTVGGDLGILLFKTSGSELATSDYESFRVVRSSKCGRFRIGNIFETEGSSGKAMSGGVSETDSRSCGFLIGKHLIAWIHIIILMQVKV